MLSKTLQYDSIQNSISTTCRIYFLPTNKDARFNRHYNLLISTVDSLLILYSSPVTRKLHYASNVWDCTTSTDSKKLECFQWKFVAHCQYHFLNNDHVTYEDFLQFQELHTLQTEGFILTYFFFYFCLIRFEMLATCFAYYWNFSS